jgi:hypothetical protein
MDKVLSHNIALMASVREKDAALEKLRRDVLEWREVSCLNLSREMNQNNSFALQAHHKFTLPVHSGDDSFRTVLLPGDAFKSVEIMHSAQNEAMCKELISLDRELQGLRAKVKGLELDLKTANER